MYCKLGLIDELQLITNAIRNNPNGFKILTCRDELGQMALDVACQKYKKNLEYAALTPYPDYRHEVKYQKIIQYLLEEVLNHYRSEACNNAAFLQSALFHAALIGHEDSVLQILEIATSAHLVRRIW